MKKIFLIIFLIVPLNAGRPFIKDSPELLYFYETQLSKIRTQLGYEMREEYEQISDATTTQLLRQFFVLWEDFQIQKKWLRSHYDSSALNRAKFFNLTNEFARDKKVYDAEWKKYK